MKNILDLDLKEFIGLGVLFALLIFPVVAGLLWIISSIGFNWIFVAVASSITGLFISFKVLLRD